MQSLATSKELAERLSDLTKPAVELEECLLASATYDGDLRLAVLKFYDHKAGRFWLWRDNTGHKPYCVEGDTLMLGDNVTIAEIGQGNHVLGLSGEVGVEAKTSRPYHGNMIRIQASGLLPFRITPEHPVLVSRSRRPGHGSIIEFEEPHWKLPLDLKPKGSLDEGDYLVMPIARSRFSPTAIPLSSYSKMRSGWLKVAQFPINEDTAWLLGVYAAEGSPGGRRGAVFSLNKSEGVARCKIRRIARGIGYSAYFSKNETNSVNVHLGGSVLARAMRDWCGDGAENKRIPDFILLHSNLKILRSFLEGYSSGDGSKEITKREKSTTESQTMSSTSKLLVLQIQQAYARLGILARITLQHKEGMHMIQGRKVHQAEAYTVRFVKQPNHTHAKLVGDLFYIPIRKVETVDYSGRVYNIQTSDGTYLVNNVVVHNCYTRLGADELAEIRSRKDVLDIVEEEKLDLLNDTKVKLRKIITTDPLAIGGGNDSIRDRVKAWEADIKYYENYAYDRGLRMGTYYRVSNGKVIPVEHPVPERVARSLEEILKRNPQEFTPYLKEWAELLGEPLSDFRRIALDIEVANEAGRLPDTEDPRQAVIAVSFFNEEEKTVYLLRSGKTVEGLEGKPFAFRVFENETDLLRAVMYKIMEYPVVVTFNGDDFDLRYLKHRAERLGILEDEDPIQLERVAASLKHGIHIDLYQFFRNKSIQVYAFGNRYTEHTLNGIAEALLNKSKVDFEGEIGDLPLLELAGYCLKDSELTYELTSVGGAVVMKLLLVISRIGKMPINDVSRLGVSNWIRSMLFFEHRKIGALIPRQDELAEKGGASSQAIIKGKKYKGGLVMEPRPGVFFDVSVLDFASLYPSLIKVYNLSYETVNCTHEVCRNNTVPETGSWVCTKRKGLESLVIGSLRDLRVSHYKPMTKDASLSKEERELYNVSTQALKVFLNAAYGTFGFESFAFYCLPVAEATAALGRYLITKTISKCGELGIGLLYGDSVTAERCITLLDPEGHIKVLPIEEFFKKQATFVTRPDGKEESHPVGWEALSMDPESKAVTFKPVKAVIRHKSSKKIYRVYQKWGCTRVTEDHSLLVENDGVLELATPSTLGDKNLTRAWPIPTPNELMEIDVFELLRPYEYDMKYKGRIKKMRAHCDDVSVWYGWTNRKNPAKVRRFIKVSTPEFQALVNLLGAYVPEGSSSTPDTTRSRLGATIACSDAVWLSQLRLNYLTLFSGVSAGIIRSNPRTRHLAYSGKGGGLVELDYEDKTCKLQMMNGLAAVFFKAFCGQKSHGKHLPDFIFNVPSEYKQTFLRNMVKGDGSKVFGSRYSQEYAERNFRYETKSSRLASGLSVLLTQLGMGHTIRFRPSKTTYVFATSSRYNKRKGPPIVTEEQYDGYVYDLSVEDFHTFVDSCGSIVLKNTDSLFLQSPSKEQISTVARWADAELGVELDLDKTYRYVAFSSRKKNYFGVLPDGTADIKGLTGKKSQTPEYLKETFYSALEILSRVKTETDFEEARAETRALLTRMISQLKKKEVPVEKLAFNVMMGKPTERYNGTTPQHVRAAKLLEERGREIKAGEIIAYVKTKNPPYVKPVELAKVDEVDSDKYIEYAHSMFDQILDALDFSFDEIMGATTLDFFWSS